MADEIQDYLNYIKGLGIEAWIPDTAGYGPKMSVAEKCRSRILCLDYNGSQIYIRGNTLDAINEKCSTCAVETRIPAKAVKLEDLCQKPIEKKTSKICTTLQMNQYYCNSNMCTTGSTNASEESSSNTDSLPTAAVYSIRRSVGIQCDGLNDIIDNTFKLLSPMPIEKSVDFDDNSENNTFNCEEGYKYKRIVNEKLTREVRVAKCYVSSLPNKNPIFGNSQTLAGKSSSGQTLSSLDYGEILTKTRQSGLNPGSVRQLIKRFNVCDNVEQQ